MSGYCRRSGQTPQAFGRPKDGVWYRHTDGWNDVREDLGGLEALKRGIEKIHKMGQHLTLYVEFYIVPMESELYDHKPHAVYWRVYDSNQNRDFEYSDEYYFYM
jgi:hypothetical protein